MIYMIDAPETADDLDVRQHELSGRESRVMNDRTCQTWNCFPARWIFRVQVVDWIGLET